MASKYYVLYIYPHFLSMSLLDSSKLQRPGAFIRINMVYPNSSSLNLSDRLTFLRSGKSVLKFMHNLIILLDAVRTLFQLLS